MFQRCRLFVLLVFVGWFSNFTTSAQENSKIPQKDPGRGKNRLFDSPCHQERITSITITPDGKKAITGSFDGTARLWDLETGELIRQFRDAGEPWGGCLVLCVALTPDGKILALSHRGEAGITLWDVATGEGLGRLTGHVDRIDSIAFSPDGKTLISEGIDDIHLHLWNARSLREIRRFKKNQIRGLQAVFAPNGRTIASVADGLYLWEADTGKLLHHLKEPVEAAAFSSDGFLLATAREGKVQILETATRREVACYDAPHKRSLGDSLAFSPDGQYLAVASEKEVQLLEVLTGRKVRALAGHQGELTCLAFSPDGKTLLTGAQDRTVLRWNLADLAEKHDKTPLKPEQCQALWDDLKGSDRLKAFESQRRLLRSPGPTLALLQKRLQPVAAVDPKQVARLIADLDSDQFQTRDSAVRQLQAMGDLAEDALRRALKDAHSVEVRKQIEQLLEKTELSFETCRDQWALGFLERTSTAEARRLLEELARGEPRSWQTREARTILQRLAQKAAVRSDLKRLIIDKAPRTDIHGAPLPPGAIARLGVLGLKHADRALSVAFSPDGKTLASGGQDKMIKLWDAEKGKELRSITGHESGVACIAFSPDGRTLISESWDKTIRFWDVATGKELPRIINHPGQIHTLAVSPDGKLLASTVENNVCLWDATTGKEVRRWKAHHGGISSLAFSPDGKHLVSGGHDGVRESPKEGKGSESNSGPIDDYAAALWETATGKKLLSWSEETHSVSAVAFSPDGKTVAVLHFRSIGFYDPASGKEVRRIKTDFLSGPRHLVFAPDGKSFALSDGGTIYVGLWSIKNAHTQSVSSLAFSPDSKTLASAGEDGQVRLWDVAQLKDRFESPGHQQELTGLAISPDGKTAVTADYYGTTHQWELTTGKQIRQFRDQAGLLGRGVILSIALSPDGKTLAQAHHGGISFWDVATGKLTGEITASIGRFPAIAFSPDGKTLASEGSEDKFLHLWDVAARKENRALIKKDKDGYAVVFSPDGQLIASSAGGLYLWETATGKLLHHLKDAGGKLAFSPDGFLLASASMNKVRLLEAATAKEITQYNAGDSRTGRHAIAFSPDGKVLAVTSDQDVLVLEAATGCRVGTFRGHLKPITCLAFTPDGKALISGAEDCTALVWNVSSLVEEKELPPLTPEQSRACWDDLKDSDRLKAYDAQRRLARFPEQTLALLRKELRPAAVAEPKRPEEASLEGRRIEWAIHFLERSGTAPARRFLEELALGEPQSWQTREAKGAIQRLKPPMVKP